MTRHFLDRVILERVNMLGRKTRMLIMTVDSDS
jgi:hypothetical protein